MKKNNNQKHLGYRLSPQFLLGKKKEITKCSINNSTIRPNTEAFYPYFFFSVGKEKEACFTFKLRPKTQWLKLIETSKNMEKWLSMIHVHLLWMVHYEVQLVSTSRLACKTFIVYLFLFYFAGFNKYFCIAVESQKNSQ